MPVKRSVSVKRRHDSDWLGKSVLYELSLNTSGDFYDHRILKTSKNLTLTFVVFATEMVDGWQSTRKKKKEDLVSRFRKC